MDKWAKGYTATLTPVQSGEQGQLSKDKWLSESEKKAHGWSKRDHEFLYAHDKAHSQSPMKAYDRVLMQKVWRQHHAVKQRGHFYSQPGA
jgi:hypothetical protein